MKKWKIALCICLLLAGFAAVPHHAAAASYTLENTTAHALDVALLLPSTKGWYVSQWHKLQPYSRKTVTKNWAIPGQFGFYVEGTHNKNIKWAGSSTAYVSNAASTHPYNKTPPGNVRKVGFRTKKGNSVKLTLKSNPSTSGGKYPPPPGQW